MAEPIFTFISYFKYRFKARNAHGLHSPFVYTLYQHVIRSFDISLAQQLFGAKKKYLNNKRALSFKDPKSGRQQTVTVRSIASRSTSSIHFQVFLVRLINYLGYKTILETGTSLGLTTAALSHSEATKITSIEGVKEIAEIAVRNFEKLPAGSKIELKAGAISDLLEAVLQKDYYDLIFLDADHRSEVVKFCVKAVMKQEKYPSCIIIHDIYWSRDMNRAWQEIINDRRFPLTIDLFEAGIIFLNQPLEKQHFVLRF